MAIRKRIAAWLDPEAARDAERHWRLRTVYLDEARTWLGADFPVVDEVIYWALVSDRNHFRSLDEQPNPPVPTKPWIYAIHEFREHLREKYPAAIRKGTPA